MHLLLVEDDTLISRELSLRWRGRGWLVQACASLSDASAALAQQGGFDLIVLDLGLPDGDGMDWLARLRQRDRNTPVLVLTARDRVVDRVRGLQGGADDYLVKPFAADELDARVEVLTRRAEAARGEIAQYGLISWLGREGRAYVDGRALELSPREFEVLGLLIRRAPKLVPKRVLIDALAERNLEVGDSAAEVYVSRLRRKLAGSGTVIRTLRGFGYLLALDDGAAETTTDEEADAPTR
ncbi:MAG TPA: response regulator transcription factor [Methylibium sp.]